jgi:hypothetical protein
MRFGNFSGRGENDMILRNVNTGALEVYNIGNNRFTGFAFLGTVGLNWQMAGISNHGTQSDLVLRDSGSGGLEIYNINNNAITGAAFLGSVGLDWQVSGFGDFSSRNEGVMLLRNVNTGGLMLYDISNNQITGSFFWVTSGSTGSTRALVRSRVPAHPTWCCATSTAVRFRSTTSPTISSREAPAWARWD